MDVRNPNLNSGQSRKAIRHLGHSPKEMKSIIIFALLHLGYLQIFADSWAAQKPRTFSSPEGKYLLRSIPPMRLDE